MKRILGQDSALEQLGKALRSDRFHHAWIFSGPRGVGKCTTAVELAKILLDPQGDVAMLGTDAPDRTETQQRVQAGTHPDLHVIRKELALYSDDSVVRNAKQINIPLNVIREHMLGGTVGDKPHEAPAYRTAVLGHGKVFIIDEAELLKREAQNAMLKTLEEPPARTYLILITPYPQRLTPTIRSRCQHVRFHRLDDDAMAEWMDANLPEVTGPQRAWIMNFAEGSPGVAQRAVEYGFDHWHRELSPMIEELAAGAYPATMGARLGELVEQYAQAWVRSHTNASKDAANKDGCGAMLALLGLDARRRLQRCCADGDDTSAERWTCVIDQLREAEVQLYSNVNQKLVLENLVVQWSQAMRGAETMSAAH